MTAQPATPDGRYFRVRGRGGRRADPGLTEARRGTLVSDLMAARRDVRAGLAAADHEAVRDARSRVDRAKRALGERGPVWWSDGAPDLTRHLARTTPYADWWRSIGEPD